MEFICAAASVLIGGAAESSKGLDRAPSLVEPSESRQVWKRSFEYRLCMAKREAACSCGQLKVVVVGDPVRISVCHCLACQRRTGSVFGMQARFAREQSEVTGRSHEFVRISDDGERRSFHFCPDCGSTVYYFVDVVPDVLAIPVGAFADPAFPWPTVSVWESRKHPWVALPPDAERHA